MTKKGHNVTLTSRLHPMKTRPDVYGEDEALDHGEGLGTEANKAQCCWQPAALLGHYVK